MPAEAVANGPESDVAALAVIVEHMAIVTRGPDEVQADAVTAPVRRTFKARLEEAGEGLSKTIVHGCY